MDKAEKRLLYRTSFAEKCDFWSIFITDIQKKLTSFYPRSYDGLKLYFNELQDTANELLAKQQLMQSILIEGRKIVSEGGEGAGQYTEEVMSKMEDFKGQWKRVAEGIDRQKNEVSKVKKFVAVINCSRTFGADIMIVCLVFYAKFLTVFF